MSPLCIFHGNCPDGFTAAWIVRNAFSQNVEFHAGVYQDPPPDVTGRDVIVVDFSYKRPVLQTMLRSDDLHQANTILILDHHRTAAEDLVGIPSPENLAQQAAYNPVYWRRKWESAREWPVRCVFDMERSGAQIVWDFFFPGTPRPNLVDYVGDHDLWRFKLPQSREINAYVHAFEYTFDNWDYLSEASHDDLGLRRVAEMGGAIERKHHKDVAELVTISKRRMVIGGHKVPVANVPRTLANDAAHLMAPNEPFAACYWDGPGGRFFSLRSTDQGIDVSDVAKGYGGGGHTRAAGFRVPLGWEGDQE